ncbi:pesticidal crystal-like protein Cry17Aa [Mixophyes fleayi]|uniref:pesticidal crystal-like protein Cry17Aa n=1 Tax=Mixophyes fleayi TaxID=3061075 RepID=UPI003F4DE29E
MVSKRSRPCMTTLFLLFLFLQGNNCRNNLGGTWNDRMKDILISITAKIPPIGGIPVGLIISTLLKAFWPSSEQDIWSLIKDQVEGLIDQKILEFELQERNSELHGLHKTMEMYVEAQIREKGSLLSSMIHASNELFFKLTESKNSVQLIPLVVTHSIQHLLILKERLLHGKEMYDEDNTRVWRKDLEEQISTYKDYMKTIYSKWVDWRKDKITINLGYERYILLGPPYVIFAPYGTVYDEMTKETVKYEYEHDLGPPDRYFFSNIGDAVIKNMFGLRNGELLQIFVPSFYLDNFIPGKEDDASVIPPSMSIATFGPISPSVQIIRDQWYHLYTPGNDNIKNGEVTSINVREWDFLNGFQVIYSTHSGSFVGNREGGLLHEIQLNNRRVKSLQFCDNDNVMVEVTIGFSNGESTGRLGNRGGWSVSCVDTGSIDTYGLYNVRMAGGVSGLYQIELDFKAYPTKPSQMDTHDLHIVDFANDHFKYSSVTEVE